MWIRLAQNTVQSRTVVNMVTNLRFLKKNWRSYSPAELLSASQNGFLSTELVNKFVISMFKGTPYVLNLFDELYEVTSVDMMNQYGEHRQLK